MKHRNGIFPKLVKGSYSTKDVMALTNLSLPGLRVRIIKGRFPKADRKVGLKNVWNRDTLQKWVAATPKNKLVSSWGKKKRAKVHGLDKAVKNVVQDSGFRPKLKTIAAKE